MNHLITTKTIHNLIASAIEAQKNAYAPYSKFTVGAALLTKDGQIISGANVENASYGATICAERSALCAAVSLGHREFLAIGLVTDCAESAWPCGVCRQVLAEFAPNMPVYSSNAAGDVEMCTVSELLPKRFAAEDLNEAN